jgi:hypothetical protein
MVEHQPVQFSRTGRVLPSTQGVGPGKAIHCLAGAKRCEQLGLKRATGFTIVPRQQLQMPMGLAGSSSGTTVEEPQP